MFPTWARLAWWLAMAGKVLLFGGLGWRLTLQSFQGDWLFSTWQKFALGGT